MYSYLMINLAYIFNAWSVYLDLSICFNSCLLHTHTHSGTPFERPPLREATLMKDKPLLIGHLTLYLLTQMY